MCAASHSTHLTTQ